MQKAGEELAQTVVAAEKELRAISDSDSARRPSADKWSAREVLGHLIDSAANNHGRFVRGALEEDLVFPGYAQNEWVSLQNYHDRRWSDLVDLWVSYNLHISRVVAAIPEEVMNRSRKRHNFDEIAWKLVPASEPTTLEYFVRDYIGHMKHHLKQIAMRVVRR